MFSLSRCVTQQHKWPSTFSPALRNLGTVTPSHNLSPLLRYSPHTRPNLNQPKACNTPTIRGYSEFRERSTVGVFTPTSAALFVITGIGLFYYFRYEKAKLLEEREKERASRTYGRPNLGGPFTLADANGKPFSDKDMLGKWNLVYFGFTNCPDICPAELDKVGVVMDSIVKNHGSIFQPIFISVDPTRDTPSRMKRYLEDFHPSYIGLVGSYDDTKAVCKQYRVYFSTPPNADPKGDYLVDHSIFVYLMDPEGKFVEAFGQSVARDEMVEKIGQAVVEWRTEKGRNV